MSEFYLLPAVFDQLVAIAIILSITAASETWVRRRGAIWRWRIIDFAAVLAVVALVLGYWRWATAASERDAKLARSLLPQDPAARSFNWEYRGPDWLARLTGSRKALAFLDRVVKINSAQTDRSSESWMTIGKLTGIEHIEIFENQPSARDFANLTALPNLRSLSWGETPPAAIGWLTELRRLERLTLFNCDLPDKDVDRLKRRMPSVEIIVKR